MSDEQGPQHIDLSGFPTDGLPDTLDPDGKNPVISFTVRRDTNDSWFTATTTRLEEQSTYTRGQSLKALAESIRGGHLPTYEEVAAVVEIEGHRKVRKNPLLQEFKGQSTRYDDPRDAQHYDRVLYFGDSGFEDILWLPSIDDPHQEICSSLYMDKSPEEQIDGLPPHCETIKQGWEDHQTKSKIISIAGIEPNTRSICLYLSLQLNSKLTNHFLLVEPHQTTDLVAYMQAYQTLPPTPSTQYFKKNPPYGLALEA